MIFKKINQFDNIRQFVVNQFGTFTLTTDLKIPQIPELDSMLAGFMTNGTSMCLVADFLIIQDTDGREILYDNKFNKVVYQHLDVVEDNSQSRYWLQRVGIGFDRKLLCRKTIEGRHKRFILNVDTLALEGEYRSDFNVRLDNGSLLLRKEFDPPSLTRIGEDGHELWEYAIEGTYINRTFKQGEIKKNRLSHVLGTHGRLIWLANSSKELYALDVETGEKVFSSFDAGSANFFTLDKENDRLVSLDDKHLRIVDLSSGTFELTQTELSEVFDNLGLRPDYTGGRIPLVDTHLIFCDKFKSVVGTIGIDNAHVDWVFDLFDTRDYAMIKEMKFFADKLYVLDNVGPSNSLVGSLHIFDKVS